MKYRQLFLALGWLTLISMSAEAGWRRSLPPGLLLDGPIVRDLSTMKERIVAAGNFQDGYGTRYSTGRLSPDGKTILFLVNIWEDSNIVAEELRTVGMDGKNERVWYHARNIFDFAWSPDGRFIFVGVATLENSDMIIDTATETAWLTNVPKGFTGPVDPIWSRDGKSLFYTRPVAGPEGNNGFTIVRMDLRGENAQPMVNFPRGGGATISPNEKTVAYIPVFVDDLYLVDVATGKPRLMKKTSAYEGGQFWSPDGKWVGVRQTTERAMEPNSYYLVNVETGKWKFLIKEHGGNLSWWQPPTGPLPDCAKIVRDQLGPGRPLKEVLREIPAYVPPSSAKPVGK